MGQECVLFAGYRQLSGVALANANWISPPRQRPIGSGQTRSESNKKYSGPGKQPGGSKTRQRTQKTYDVGQAHVDVIPPRS